MLWSITSKAFERSKNIPMGTSFWSIDEATSLRKEKMAVSVDFDFLKPCCESENALFFLRKFPFVSKKPL